MPRRNGTTTEPRGSALYEVLKGIDFERRELVDKTRGVGLFDLVKDKAGAYKCYACTLCERTCPVDCIEIDYCPEFEELPFDVEAERAAALLTLPGESCGAGAACVMGEQPAGFVPEIDMKLFDPVIAGIRAGSGLVEALHATQDAYGYLPRVALENIAEEAHLPFSRVFGVASFYAPVPAHAGRQARHQRLHGHRLPRRRRAARSRGLRAGARHPGRQHHARPALHAARPSTASAPAPSPPRSAWAKR